MYIENSDTSATINTEPAATPREEEKRYEVRRPPYDDASSPYSQYAPAPPAADAPTYSTAPATAYSTNAPAPANNTSPYHQLTIRTQSPYQPATSTGQYANPNYGGQAVGGTGPDTTPVGSNPYSVKPAAITSPQLPPPYNAPGGAVAPGPAVAVPAGPTPAFGPPPIAGAPVETLPAPQGAPQYSPAPAQPAPAPIFGQPMVPSGPPGPDQRITPIPPLPTSPYPADSFTPMSTDPPVDMDVVLSEAQTGRLMLGVAVNSDAGLVGQILLDESSFDLSRYPTSWEDFVSGKAWRGGGQHLRIEAAPGTEVQRYLVSFTEPYLFDSPYSLGTSASYFTRQYRDWNEQRVGGRVQLGYQWVENDLSTSVAYRGEDVEISNPSILPGDPNSVPQLNEVLGHNAVHGFKWAVANDTRDSAFLATEGHFLQMELEEVVGSFQYPRAIFDARQYMLLNERPDHSGRHVLTLASKVGFTGNSTPIYDTFYAGGFSSFRGFDFRGVSPVAGLTKVQVGGDFEFLNTVEYLFPLTADDMIHGVTFVDFGTVNEDVALNNFRVAPGFGLRITVPAMGPAPIALDFAFPIAKAKDDLTQVFSFSVGLQR
jgi:outer membrane protein insertion porin family